MVGRVMRASRTVRSDGMSGGWFVGGCGPGRLLGRVGCGVRVGLPGRVGRVSRPRKCGGRGWLAGTVRKWGGGVGRSVGVGTVERACRADVGRAFAGMEQNGFCGE